MAFFIIIHFIIASCSHRGEGHSREAWLKRPRGGIAWLRLETRPTVAGKVPAQVLASVAPRLVFTLGDI
jgi:hypothetical protein